MKRAVPWSDDDNDDEDSSSDESSGHDTDTETGENGGSSKKNTKTSGSSKVKKKEAPPAKRKGIDFEALSRHGYKGGLSVLKVPPPKETVEYNLSWSTGKERREPNKSEETFEERQKTRAALLEGEQLRTAQTQKEKNLSFSQKEKRKRDLGQASRAKNYVEEEKRLLRDNGVYSGFDS